MAVVDPNSYDVGPVQPPVRHVADAQNPAAVAYADQQLHRLVAAHLLAAMPQNMTDPTQVWRGLSATLAQNPTALQAFLNAPRQPIRSTPAGQSQFVPHDLPLGSGPIGVPDRGRVGPGGQFIPQPLPLNPNQHLSVPPVAVMLARLGVHS